MSTLPLLTLGPGQLGEGRGSVVGTGVVTSIPAPAASAQ